MAEDAEDDRGMKADGQVDATDHMARTMLSLSMRVEFRTRTMRLTNISAITVQFSAFGSGRGAASARAFLQRVTSDKARQSNPKCAITPVVLPAGSAAPPTIVVSYSDGLKTELRPDEMTVRQIVEELQFNESRFPEEAEPS